MLALSRMETIPEPMRVNAKTIQRCRDEIDSPLKRHLRQSLIPALKYRHKFVDIGEGFQWGWPLRVSPHDVRVGRYVYIGAYSEISGPIVIGDLCMISTHVRIVGDDHRADVLGSPTRLEFARDPQLTIIEAECWVGSGAVIKAGVTIGRGAVVGACSFISKSVAPYTVVGGVSAKVLRRRFSDEEAVVHDRALYDR